MNDLMFDTVKAGWYVVVRDGFSSDEAGVIEADASGAMEMMSERRRRRRRKKGFDPFLDKNTLDFLKGFKQKTLSASHSRSPFFPIFSQEVNPSSLHLYPLAAGHLAAGPSRRRPSRCRPLPPPAISLSAPPVAGHLAAAPLVVGHLAAAPLVVSHLAATSLTAVRPHRLSPSSGLAAVRSRRREWNKNWGRDARDSYYYNWPVYNLNLKKKKKTF
ncbi:hypothetical protein OSB04_un001623 [Centaurea solstitialis]|uniref:Uncharacterized protein n=1 Tax=Centaurea solstitialis TaxID=347529 RepID=A0AA38VUI3_9ASTR|nr:hypothetical protein OSB04_un001623 [Centaurea solstitialis]